MSDSDSSSVPSPSPPASPVASFHEPPSLERLVVHFVSAKRSLTSTSNVWRANEIVNDSRALIEELAVLNAKNAFARKGVDEELHALQAIRGGIASVGNKAEDEFKVTIASLDEANERLQHTLETMRKTVVDSSLQLPSQSPPVEQDDAELEASGSHARNQRTLFDFIDEANHQDILGSLRGLIDTFRDATADLDTTLGSFDSSLKSISDELYDSMNKSGPTHRSTIYDEPPMALTDLFHGMEDHAAEMATLLQSLISHYDLSVTALKHTEGGGAAAKQAIQAEELTKNTPGAEESLYGKTVPEPISDEERTEMLDVLENDAIEVEDVTAEIRDRNSEMEGQYSQLMKRVTAARSANKGLRSALSLLYKMQSSLPAHIAASRVFRESWLDIQANMQSRTEDLVHLSKFHSDFLSSYDKLLQEVSRRQAADVQMRKIAEKARREMDRLYEADREARETFMDQVGEYLPGDIWAGLQEGGTRWTMRKVSTGGENK